MQIGDLIRRAGRQFGPAPALVDGDRSVSFAGFDELTDRLGHALLARGLAPGDRVAVLMPNGIDGVVAYYALAKAGLVRVPLNSRETPHEHAYKIDDSQARALIYTSDPPAEVEIMITAAELPGLIAGAPAGPCDVRRDPGAPLRLAYTGGTTGQPKAVVLTTRSELAEVANFLVDLLPNTRPGSVMLHAAPITHGSGAFFLPHLVKGAPNVILPKFSPAAFLTAAKKHRATSTFMVPTMIAMLLEEPATASAGLVLERLCYGGAPIAPTVLERGIGLLGPVFAQLYGQAEAPLAITCLQPWEHTPDRLSSAGKPYTFVEVQLRDTEGRVLGPGQVGEVLTRGPHTMSRYWRRPEATAETIEPDGWLHTGDIGRWDEAGYLYLLDRRHDVIISGGFNVYPREVEDTLLSHPAVAQAAVVGLPDEKWGERVAAAVVTRTEADEADIIDYCAGRLAGFKRPRVVEIWPDLPVSPVGKSLRREVRDRMVMAAGRTNMLDPSQLTLHALTLRQLGSAAQLAEVTGQPEAGVDSSLEKAVGDGYVIAARGSFMIAPPGRDLLDAVYPEAFAALRADPAVTAAMDSFETGVNKQVLHLTTDWQTMEVGGQRVPNDHGDPGYDEKIIDKLGRVIDKTAQVLAPIADADPLTSRFLDRLGTALTRAEGGETDYVSGVRVDSVHTVWFQLHEHLLRLTGRERPE